MKFVLVFLYYVSGKPSALTDVHNPDWVPSVKMGYYSDFTSSSPEGDVQKYEQARRRAVN